MPPSSDPVIDDAIERLVFEFAGRVSPQTVAAVVRRSRNDLDSCPPAALPELTERLARQRVHDRLPVPGVASAVLSWRGAGTAGAAVAAFPAACLTAAAAALS